MTLIDRLTGRRPVAMDAAPVARSAGTFGGGSFLFGGTAHDVLSGSLPGSPPLEVGDNFVDRIRTVHEGSGPVSAAVVARQWPLTQVEFKWRNDTTGALFGNTTLDPVQRVRGLPDSRAKWLALAERHVSYAGNSYTRMHPDGRLTVLRPDWVSILLMSTSSPDRPDFGDDAEVVGYLYHPGGKWANHGLPAVLLPHEVIHWAPEPHPLYPWLGESWVTSVVREIVADDQAAEHIQKFFTNAATSNMVVTAPAGISREQFEAWVDAFEGSHSGIQNAWKNIYMMSGTDVQVVGSSMHDIEMAELQGGFESRIASRSRVPSTVLGFREGTQGSALFAGNYDSSRRLWADTFVAPYIESLCQAVERVLVRPAGASLSFDPRRVLILQEDRDQAAKIVQTHASTIGVLYAAGFDPDAAVAAVVNGDLSSLSGAHSGRPSVQTIDAASKPAKGQEASTE